jgi:DNA-binding MarR family transcriptional regulator
MPASAERPRESSTSGVGARPLPSLLYTVKQVELVARARLDELLRPSGVTTLQYTAMTVLARTDGLTAAELARNSFVTAQTMMDLVGGLERRGLISRMRDPTHRRRLRISLTEKGRAFLDEYDAPVRDVEERMLADLSAEERTMLRDLLNRCRGALAAPQVE